MEVRTCKYCGERAVRAPFASADEWLDVKGERWLFHSCAAKPQSSAFRAAARHRPKAAPYVSSPARKAAVHRRLEEREQQRQIKRDENLQRRKKERKRFYCKRAAVLSSKRHQRQGGRRDKNLELFKIVAHEVELPKFGTLIAQLGLRAYSKPKAFRAELREYVRKKIFADDVLMRKYDAFVAFHTEQQAYVAFIPPSTAQVEDGMNTAAGDGRARRGSL